MGVLALLVITTGECPPDFGSDREIIDMSYDEYVSRVGSEILNPIGGSRIYFKSHSTRDGYDMWIKLHLPSPAYESLLTRMSTNMQDPNYVSNKENIRSPVNKTVGDDPIPPGNWPKAEINPPVWFEPVQTRHHASCILWDVQLIDRSKGWHWCYDNDSETLRIWEWNRQHFTVR
jgi:hypothetical protein